MIKMNYVKVIIIIFNIFYINNSWAKERVYIKKTYFTNQPKSSIAATSTDETTKWFDDYPKAESNEELEIGFYLPKDLGLTFRNSKITGVHSGAATKYVCILGLCSYVSGGIVSGNSSTDKISYQIDSWQIMLDRFFKLNDKAFIKPRFGINLLDTSLSFAGAGENMSETQIIPLPFLGFHSEIQLDPLYSLYLDTNFFKYKESKIAVNFNDTSIGINSQINKYIKITAGYKKYNFGISNKGGSSNISFDIEQKTPFVALTISY